MSERITRDVLVGLGFVLFGALIWYLGQDLPRGTAVRMGPGYVPTMLAGITAALGALLAATSIGRRAAPDEPWNLAAGVTIVAAILVFAFTISPFGALPSLTLAGIVGQAPRLRRQPVAVVALSLAVAAALTGIFVVGLGMYIPILPGG